MAAGLFGGVALQPAASKAAISVIEFSMILIFAAFNLCHVVGFPSNGLPARAKFISTSLEMR
jgi:hypothetical protein